MGKLEEEALLENARLALKIFQNDNSEKSFEKKKADICADKQREAKQLPEVLKLIQRYQLARKNLETEKSAENYQEVLSICYSIIGMHNLVNCLDEFSGVKQYYEDTSMEYFYRIKKVVDSVYITEYGTNKELLHEIHHLQTKKESILQGLQFVEPVCEMFPEYDDCPEKYVNCHILLYWCCLTGGDLEQETYAVKAYRLAKKFALEFKTEKMITTLENAMSILRLYYMSHQQEKEVEELEEDYQKILDQIC